MTSTLVFYNTESNKVGVSFWESDSDSKTTLSTTCWLSPSQASNLAGRIIDALVTVPPEPRVVSAEDLGL